MRIRSLLPSATALWALLFVGCTSLPPRPSPPNTVVLISIDGLRSDAVGRGRMPTLDRLAAQGVQAEWMNPAYPTLTFPNHYTLVTGLRPDRHGIVDNTMRDPLLGNFSLGNREAVADPRWWGGEPLWVTLQKHGRSAATMFWPGSEAPIAGQHPRYWHRFDAKVTAAQRADQVLAWLDLPAGQRPGFITLYFDQVDHAAHADGPHSAGTLAAMGDVDAALQRLLDGLQARGLRDRTDLVVLSDHGMAEVPRGNEKLFDERIAADAIDMRTYGQIAGLSAVAGREREVEAALLGRHDRYACWRKAELPAQWQYGTHPRIAPIVCQADAGWELTTRARRRQRPPLRGAHGYAPETTDMRAVFIASGPDFATGRRIGAFDNVDVYPLLTSLLGIPAQPNDGRIAPLLPALSAQGRARVAATPLR